MDNGEIDLWSTHLPVLLEAVLHTSGPVLEVGSGHYSTRLLHVLAGAFPGRRFVTCDPQPAWLARVGLLDLQSENHEILSLPDCQRFVDEARNLNWPWEVVFIDEAPAQHRCPEIVRLRPVTRLFVINNTEPHPDHPELRYRPAYRGYEVLLPTFPHRWTYQRYPVWTDVLSDEPLPEWVGRSL